MLTPDYRARLHTNANLPLLTLIPSASFAALAITYERYCQQLGETRPHDFINTIVWAGLNQVLATLDQLQPPEAP